MASPLISLALNSSQPRIHYATTSRAREMVRRAAFTPTGGSAAATRLSSSKSCRSLAEVFALPLPDDVAPSAPKSSANRRAIILWGNRAWDRGRFFSLTLSQALQVCEKVTRRPESLSGPGRMLLLAKNIGVRG